MRTFLPWILASCGVTEPPAAVPDPIPSMPAAETAEPPPDDTCAPASTWRSALYPDDWTPAFTLPDGRFLHDHSDAGYHAGDQPLPSTRPTPVVDVRDHGADPTGATDSADAIQAAIDAVAGGGTVWLPAGRYRVDRQLDFTHSGVVVAGDGPDATFVHFTQSEDTRGAAGLRLRGGAPPDDVRWPLVDDGVSRAATVRVADPTGLAVGDGVAVGWTITPAFVAEHGMTGVWVEFVGEHKPFFRRTVVAIDGDVVTLDVPLRYPARTRDGAALTRDETYLREVGIEGLAVSTVVDRDAALAADRHHALELDRVQDAWITRVASFDPVGDGDHLQSGGIYVQRSRRVTVAEVRLGQAQHRGGGGNGYLFELSRSGEVLVRDSEGRAGRHAFIQNWDFGTTGCVFLRTWSHDGVVESGPFTFTGLSEFHHSLALANLIDQSVADDGWQCANRHRESTGAGHAGTQNTFWNLTGSGVLNSWQQGMGYIVGTGPALTVVTDPDAPDLGFGGDGTAPEDHVEGLGQAATLRPASLYEDQLARRHARAPAP